VDRDDFRVGERSGEQALTVYGLSPYLFPRYKTRNWKYLPLNRDLPQHNVEFTVIKAMWGFGGTIPGLASREVQNQIIQIKKPTFIWAIAGVSNDATGPSGSNQGFLFQIYQTHNSVQSRWYNRPVSNTEGLGSGQGPLTLLQPHPFLPQDSVEFEVHNLGTPTSPSVTSISIALFAGEYEGQF
jgi:hypothetical protein